jgi:hypothetical protein
METAICTRELSKQFRSRAALRGLVALESALWPSIGDMAGLKEMYAKLPRSSAARRPAGDDYRTRLPQRRTFHLAAAGSVPGVRIGHGARAPAGEEDDGTLDLLLVTRSPAGESFCKRLWRCSPACSSSARLSSSPPSA